MFAQCIHLKNPSNQLKQRLITQIQICSSLVGSTTRHLIVLPVREFWQFGPWWIPKLRNQPVFRLNLEIPSVSCPLEFVAPCGVKQPNISYAVSSANFIFNTEDRIQSDFLVVFIGWMLVFRVGYKSWNTTLVAMASNKKQLGSQNGEDGNQLAFKFQSLRMGELVW